MTIKIDDLIPLIRPGWIAMDEDGTWCWFTEEPKKLKSSWYSEHFCYLSYESYLKEIEPAEDWANSLRKVD